ncbi:MAG: sugar efflux transporter [Hamadaea sp.]|uniref:sugar efflux transporter n=1 Tax=Hamadaea sp. TaxID=2024425 RepID=UPI0017981291|nr:sugar efflux transporter [Hamadaea sp.]NUR71734.1 sugar efflux transporter [Hamadaea sp.]NUT19048.1 sugar efflux transporter [Hamadaea sp.]
MTTTETRAAAGRLGRAMLPLALVFFSVGVSTALVYPFLALFLDTAVHASPLQITVFLVVSPLSGVFAASALGRLSDRRAVRRGLMLLAAVGGFASAGLTAVVRNYWLLLTLAVTGWALANALFPQTLAYARQVLVRDRPDRATLGLSALRTVFSVAWVVGPSLAAFVMKAGGFTWLYAFAGAMYAVAGLLVFFLFDSDQPQPKATPSGAADADVPLETSWWTLMATAAGFTLLQAPLTLISQVLPIYIGRYLGGDVTDTGLILGVCAFLEIPFMLGLGAITSRISVRTVVLAGSCCGVAYFALASTATAVWHLVAAQILNALFISAVAGVGISYMQGMLPRHPGRATALFTNSFPIGAMVAGPLFGVAQHFGFRLAWPIATAVCAVGLLLLWTTRPTPAAEPAVT